MKFCRRHIHLIPVMPGHVVCRACRDEEAAKAKALRVLTGKRDALEVRP